VRDVAVNGASDFAIGARRDTAPLYFDGRIDEVGLWKRVLTTAERTALYNSGAGVADPFAITRSYYYAGGQRIAERVQVGITNTLYYLHSDQLGSTSVVTCGSTGSASACATLGAEVARQYYYPWGLPRYTTAALPTGHTFTGQIADDTGLRRFAG